MHGIPLVARSRRCNPVPLAIGLAVACSGAASAYTDVEIVALELSGELLAPPEVVAQVDADLAAIRAYNSYFESLHVFADWFPGELIVGLTADAWQQYLAGDYHGLDELNGQYGPVSVAVCVRRPKANTRFGPT